MSKFYMGQRVRVKFVRKNENAHLVGVECRITEIHQFSSFVAYGLDICPVEIEVVSSLFLMVKCFRSEQLEPILPEGHRPAELTVEELLPFLKEQVAA